jgi:hypothetical protein
MSQTPQRQAALYFMRRARRSRQFTAGCTPWISGLVVQAGDVCQSDGLAWTAQNSGTTAGVAPTNADGASFADAGGVEWLHTPLLLTQPPQI